MDTLSYAILTYHSYEVKKNYTYITDNNAEA